MRTKDDEKEAALFEATVKLVNEIGFAASSVSKIAREAGVSPATIYIYHKNKEDLLVSTYIEIKLNLSKALLRDFDERLPIRDILRNVWFNMFEYIATKENAARVKPAPDVHFHVLEKLSARPQECLVVEDAEKGVKAATSAGLRCVAIPNRLTAGHDFSGAALVLDSISELTPDRLRELGQRALETA